MRQESISNHEIAKKTKTKPHLCNNLCITISVTGWDLYSFYSTINQILSINTFIKHVRGFIFIYVRSSKTVCKTSLSLHFVCYLYRMNMEKDTFSTYMQAAMFPRRWCGGGVGKMKGGIGGWRHGKKKYYWALISDPACGSGRNLTSESVWKPYSIFNTMSYRCWCAIFTWPRRNETSQHHFHYSVTPVLVGAVVAGGLKSTHLRYLVISFTWDDVFKYSDTFAFWTSSTHTCLSPSKKWVRIWEALTLI